MRSGGHLNRLSWVVSATLLVAACGAPPQASSAAPTAPPPTAETTVAGTATALATVLPAAPPTAVPTTVVAVSESALAGSDSAPRAASLDGTVQQVSAPGSGAASALAPETVSTDPGAGDPGMAADPNCDGSARADPLPAPGTARSQDFFRSFRTPLPPAPLYDPPGQKRVGLQAGHWLTDQVPPELGRLQGGSFGGGKQEWEVNLDVAQRAAARLEAAGIAVDVLPSTIPRHYQANAFVAIHADGDPAGGARGFKVARPGFSSIPDVDDKLVDALNSSYGAVTELPRDDEHISLRMRYYYAFNSRRYCHAVAPGVPQAIIELAYLTSGVDRQYLIGEPDRLAQGVATGIEAFLATLP